MKISVLGHDHEPVLGCIGPHCFIVGRLQANVTDVRGAWVGIRKRPYQPGRQVVVEEQFHAGGTERSLRSRSAANARQARISSRVRSGKSARISSSDMPEARYSRTS